MLPKFRGWCIYEDRMYEITDIMFEDNLIGISTEDIDNERNILGFEVMQSSSIFDKNNIEIYQGDIVNIYWTYPLNHSSSYSKCPSKVNVEKVLITKVYGNLGFWWGEEDKWVDLATLHLSVVIHDDSFEVLGNMYNNPNLLGELK